MSERRPGPRDLVLKTLTRVRARGLAEVRRLALDRAVATVRSDGRLTILRCATSGMPDQRDDMVLRRAHAADGPAYARDIGTDSATTFRARSNDRTWCYVVEAPGGRLLHATWCTISGAWTREIRACVVPAPGSAYVYESFTRSDARGQGVYPFALRGIAADLAATGVETLWVAVEADNVPSLRAVGKAGFEPVDEIVFRRRWGRVELEGPAMSDGLQVQPECG